MNALRLAWAYLAHHPLRTLALVLATALVIATPLAVHRLIAAGEARMAARAETTPLVVGARGSRLDLAMAALYFTDDRPGRLTMAAAEAIWDGGLAEALPLHRRFEAGGAPIVGVTLDYFAFRGLETAEGRGLALLGEAVLGAAAAARLGLGPGDSIVSSPENLFDLDGAYPLKMAVVGVLAPTGGPDDRAIFVDLRTAWVIEGVGHGHDDVATAGGPDPADPAPATYREITPETIDSFHFHGDPATFPVDAIIAVPADSRASTILRGRYLDPAAAEQIIVPADVIGALFERVFRLRQVLDAVSAAMGAAALLSVGLALFLSMQLRRREMETAFRLGAPRLTTAKLVAAEAVIILCLAGAAALAMVWTATGWVEPLARALVGGA